MLHRSGNTNTGSNNTKDRHCGNSPPWRSFVVVTVQGCVGEGEVAEFSYPSKILLWIPITRTIGFLISSDPLLLRHFCQIDPFHAGVQGLQERVCRSARMGLAIGQIANANVCALHQLAVAQL